MPLPFVLLISILLGIIFGSFSNVLILRHGTGLGVYGRSRCMACGATLTMGDLVPIVSFVRQKGRCRYCGVRFSWHYAFIEILGGLYGAMIALTATGVFDGFFLVLAGIPLLVIVGYDLKHFIIPPYYARLLWLIAAASLVVFFTQATIVAGLGLILFFYSIWLFSDGKAMGFGDVGLVGALALLFGYPESVIGTVFAFWIGAVVGICLLFQSRSGLTLKSEVPFGPFLVIGFMLAQIVSHYLSLNLLILL